MQIVIEIDEERYNYIKTQVADGIDNPLKVCIANGTPLPAKHGRLIDADELKMYGSWQMQLIPEGNGKYVETKIYTQRAVDAMPTIIPADKEESE